MCENPLNSYTKGSTLDSFLYFDFLNNMLWYSTSNLSVFHLKCILYTKLQTLVAFSVRNLS